MLAIDVLIGVVLLLVLITAVRIHPFVSLLLVSFAVGTLTGMPLLKIADSIQTGFGNTLGFIGIVLGLGTMLGKLLEESGGAERIARTLIHLLGPNRVHWAMYLVAFIVGIPVFFQVGFVLLIPLIFTVTKELNIPSLRVGLPMLAGLSVVHGILPPHPAAMATVGILHADLGRTILYGLLVGIPSSALAGPIFAVTIAPRIAGFNDIKITELDGGAAPPARTHLPGFAVSMFTILLPVILLLLSTMADLYMTNGSVWYIAFKFVGNPITALLIALIVGIYTFGLARGMSFAAIQKHSDSSLALVASIMVIIGGGGAFSRVLVDSGAGTYVASLATKVHLSPLLFGWLVATLIRVSTGSSTVSMTTAAGIVAPLTASSGVSPELMVLAVGGGSLMLSHVNDSGFWMAKEYFRMSLRMTFLTWTVLETILGLSVLVFTLLLHHFV